MNKKFTKAAALSIAAVTALSAMALPASADLTYVTGQVNTVDTIRGTASLVTWNVYSKTITYTASLNHSSLTDTASATVTGLSSGVDSLLKEEVADDTEMAYSDNQSIEIGAATYDEKQVYLNSSANASNYTAKITNAVSYENANAGDASTNMKTAGKGETLYQKWVSDWNRYVLNLNAWKTCVNSSDPTDTWYYKKKDGQLSNPIPKATYPTLVAFNTTCLVDDYGDAIPDSTFVKTVYSSSIVTNNNVSMTDLKSAVSPTTGKVNIDPATGIISAGTTWTIGANGTGSITTPGATDSWYPLLESERKLTSSYSYEGSNGFWYTSAALANTYGGGYTSRSKLNNWSTYSSSNEAVYFDAYNGTYNTTSGAYCYLVKEKENTFYSASLGSYKAANGLYYPSVTEARNASYSYNGSTAYSTIASAATGRYFSKQTGKFYDTYSAALNASSSSSYVVDLSTYKIPTAYDYYYPNYIFNSSTGKNTGTAYIYNSKKVAGWTSIKNYIAYKSKGSAVSVAMNKDTTVPKNIFTAAKSKNVTLQFINSNGSAVVIKGSSVTDASDTNVGVSYNAKVIPTSLKNKAKKANKDVVSTAQIKIGDNGAIGATADVTVKLPAKRSGCTVKAYRYTSSGSLKLVDTSKVAKNGEVTITTDNGGYFLLVVCD